MYGIKGTGTLSAHAIGNIIPNIPQHYNFSAQMTGTRKKANMTNTRIKWIKKDLINWKHSAYSSYDVRTNIEKKGGLISLPHQLQELEYIDRDKLPIDALQDIALYDQYLQDEEKKLKESVEKIRKEEKEKTAYKFHKVSSFQRRVKPRRATKKQDLPPLNTSLNKDTVFADSARKYIGIQKDLEEYPRKFNMVKYDSKKVKKDLVRKKEQLQKEHERNLILAKQDPIRDEIVDYRANVRFAELMKNFDPKKIDELTEIISNKLDNYSYPTKSNNSQIQRSESMQHIHQSKKCKEEGNSASGSPSPQPQIHVHQSPTTDNLLLTRLTENSKVEGERITSFSEFSSAREPSNAKLDEGRFPNLPGLYKGKQGVIRSSQKNPKLSEHSTMLQYPRIKEYLQTANPRISFTEQHLENLESETKGFFLKHKVETNNNRFKTECVNRHLNKFEKLLNIKNEKDLNIDVFPIFSNYQPQLVPGLFSYTTTNAKSLPFQKKNEFLKLSSAAELEWNKVGKELVDIRTRIQQPFISKLKLESYES